MRGNFFRGGGLRPHRQVELEAPSRFVVAVAASCTTPSSVLLDLVGSGVWWNPIATAGPAPAGGAAGAGLLILGAGNPPMPWRAAQLAGLTLAYR